MVEKRLSIEDQDGFSLVSLVIAALALNVLVLGIVSAFQAGRASIARGEREVAAAAVAQGQLAEYAALPSARAIMLDERRGRRLDPVYLRDEALSMPGIVARPPRGQCDRLGPGGLCLFRSVCASGNPLACTPIQTGVRGPDGLAYRVDSYVVVCSDGHGSRSLPYKLVTVVVRAGDAPSEVFARQSERFVLG